MIQLFVYLPYEHPFFDKIMGYNETILTHTQIQTLKHIHKHVHTQLQCTNQYDIRTDVEHKLHYTFLTIAYNLYFL